MALCLDDKELEELSGYKRGSDQARWFRSQGYYVECNARGVPRITYLQVEEKRRQSTQQILSRPAPQHPTEPNVVAFRQKLNHAR